MTVGVHWWRATPAASSCPLSVVATRQTSSSGRPKSPRIQVVLSEELLEQLTAVADADCRTVSNLARVLIQNCPELVRSQRKVLGRLARDNSRRYNFGLLSLYGTRLGGEKVLPNWSIPRYDAVTLAIAGHFVLISAGESTPGSPMP